MPCNETHSVLTLSLDREERLNHFDYAKRTCQKEIGGGTGFLELCRKKSIGDILNLDFSRTVDQLNLSDPEDQFLLYLEWTALLGALSLYTGVDEPVEQGRQKIASIEYHSDGVEITSVIDPPESLPKIIPCCAKP